MMRKEERAQPRGEQRPWPWTPYIYGGRSMPAGAGGDVPDNSSGHDER